MANQVIKKDGTKEPFDGEKIRKSIELSVKDAGLSAERIAEVVREASEAALQIAAEKEEIATTELAERILSKLDEIEPSAAVAWREHEQVKSRS